MRTWQLDCWLAQRSDASMMLASERFHSSAREVAKLNPVPVALGLHLLFGLIAGVVAVLIQRP